jgi:hypothetical protein
VNRVYVVVEDSLREFTLCWSATDCTHDNRMQHKQQEDCLLDWKRREAKQIQTCCLFLKTFSGLLRHMGLTSLSRMRWAGPWPLFLDETAAWSPVKKITQGCGHFTFRTLFTETIWAQLYYYPCWKCAHAESVPFSGWFDLLVCLFSRQFVLLLGAKIWLVWIDCSPLVGTPQGTSCQASKLGPKCELCVNY